MKVIWRSVFSEDKPDEPWNVLPADPQETEVSIAFLPVDRESYETLCLRAGMELPKGNELGYMGAVSFEPNLKDVVIRDGKELSIAYIDKIAPNGQNILCTVLFSE